MVSDEELSRLTGLVLVVTILSLVVLETTTTVKDETGKLFALRGMLRDVTEQRGLEEQLLRSQRMEAVGRMAGGVAHDFNNLLTVINGRSDLIRSQLTPGSPLVAEVQYRIAMTYALEDKLPEAASTYRLVMEGWADSPYALEARFVSPGENEGESDYTPVIGVTNDFHSESLRMKVSPYIFLFRRHLMWCR